jgi:hypothetical protein
MISGALENGLFVGLARRALVAALVEGVPTVRELLPRATAAERMLGFGPR